MRARPRTAPRTPAGGQLERARTARVGAHAHGLAGGGYRARPGVRAVGVGHFTPRALAAFLRGEGFDDVRFHFGAVNETCIVAGSDSRALVGAKRLWNRAAFRAAKAGLPNLTSELQVTARRR